MSLAGVLEHSKEFEYIKDSHDPVYEDMVQATEIVKQFIIDRGLIIYGGNAIDYALRLRGDQIYPDDILKVPDFDFYSPRNIEDGYDLADLLFQRGWKESRAVNALHLKTMKVDLVDNHWIADISFVPREIFNSLPTLTYNGMKIVHPVVQRLDVHSSLSFPYDNAPMEVIFERWQKDVKRFNALDKSYKMEELLGTKSPAALETLTLPIKMMGRLVLHGFAAYALIYKSFLAQCKEGAAEEILPAEFACRKGADGGVVSFSAMGELEIVSFSAKKAILSLSEILAAKGEVAAKKFRPIWTLLPARTTSTISGVNIKIHSTKGKLLASNSVTVDGNVFRAANVQYVLRYFLGMYLVDDARAPVYLAYYISLMKMIQLTERNLDRKDALNSILFPTILTYGNKNISLSRKVMLNALYSELDGVERYKIPVNYYPARSKATIRPHPQFDVATSKFFQEDGAEYAAKTYNVE